MTDRRKRDDERAKKEEENPPERIRPFPELSRHLRGSEEVYSPDSADWLRKPSGAKGRTVPDAEAKPGATPPQRPRKVRKKRGGAGWLKIGGLLIVCVFVISLSIEKFRASTGQGVGTPTIQPTAAAAAQPVIPASPTVVIPTATPTNTPTVTPTPLPPTPTFTPTATSTPDDRFIGKTICLDPGHGGSDTGYVRQGNEMAPPMREADYNLAYALALKPLLEASGFKVVMTRTEDVDVNPSEKDINQDGNTGKNIVDPDLAHRAKLVDELQARINFCNNAGASLLVSMHINGFDKPAEGYETWYSGARNDADASKLFAEIMEEELGKEYEAAGYNAISRGANNDDHANVDVGHGGFKHYLMIGPAQDGVTPSEMPGAIVEVGFISDDSDAAFMSSTIGEDAIVAAYLHAIQRYFVTITEEFVYGSK